MRLWSLQSTEAVDILRQTGILRTPWSLSVSSPAWQQAYQWMADRMESAGINCENHAPVWAWHSCGKWKQGPTRLDAYALLSDLQVMAGVQTIEFECPDHLVLRSWYHIWCDILFHFLDGMPLDALDPAWVTQCFKVHPRGFKSHYAIQAALPYIRLAWVQDIRPLNLTMEMRTHHEGVDFSVPL
ncbi:MAG: DUF3841 domain-containing protein [Bacteroidia bacterium]|nr:DUF3841 domain-containing protein [Bacteroidia bacterium]